MSGSSADAVQRIHAEALARPRDERAAWLDAACEGDDALREEVESLLGARERMGDFLARPASHLLGDVGPFTPPLQRGDRIAAYEIEGVLGAGGTCRVYAAVQEKPRRRVALKVMRTSLATEDARRRFEQEAEILARLEHPDIATIFQAGVHEGDGTRLPWLAMESVEHAQTLIAYADAEGLDTRQRLALAVRLCGAIQHGHQKGIVHRDLKPENVLVDADGRLRIIDFGIARVAGAAGEQEILGTPAYMSPEQCTAKTRGVDARSDVYGLGVLLYELLTGHLPHDVDAVSLPEAMRRVREDTPVPIESRDRALRGDVAAMVGKALAKDPQARYASAAALADDIERHLDHRPVEARHPGFLYVLGKAARRRWLAFAAVLAVLVVALVGATVSLRLAIESEKRRAEAEFEAYVGNVAAAAAALRLNDVADARACLERAPRTLRNWEWHHFRHRLDASRAVIRWPDHPILHGTVIGEGDRVVCTASRPNVDHHVAVLALPDGRREFDLSFELGNGPTAVAMGPGAGPLLIGLSDGTVEFRDPRTGDVRRRIDAHGDRIHELASAPDGKQFATASRDGTARVFSSTTGRRLLTLEGHGDRVIDVAYRPDGKRLATAGREGTIRIWDAESGALHAVLAGHESSVEGVAWSPDGTRLVSASRDESVRMWEAETGTEIWAARRHTANVRDVAYAPDGQTVASASYDRTVRIWNAENGASVALLRGHEGGLRSVAYAADTVGLVTFAQDGTVRIWDAASQGVVPTLRGHTDRILGLGLDGKGERLLTASFDGTIRQWDVTTRREVGLIARSDTPYAGAFFLQEGTKVFGLSLKGEAVLWSAVTGGAERRFIRIGIRGFALCPRSGRFYCDDYKGRIRGFEVASGAHVGSWPVNEAGLSALAANRSETLLAAGGQDGTVQLLRLPAMELLAAARPHRKQITNLCFGPRGELASCSIDGPILLFEPERLTPSRRLEGQGGVVHAIAFSPDGTRLVSAGDDETVRLWDVASGRQVAVLHGHRHSVRCVLFSPDGEKLFSAGGAWEDPNSHVRIWEAPRQSAQESR